MKTLLRYLFFFFIFWLLVFFVSRVTFLISITLFLHDVSFSAEIHALFAGWLLDLSTIAYFAAVPALLIAFSFILRSKIIAAVNDVYVSLLIILYCLTAFGELCLYQEWRAKLNVQALQHFRHPAEVFQSTTFSLTFLFFTLVILYSALFIFYYRRRFAYKRFFIPCQWSALKRILFAFLFLVIFFPVDLLLLRGGWKAIPISESDAYFSSSHLLNDAAVNPLWSLGHNVMEYGAHQKENPYKTMPDEEANAVMHNLFAIEKDTTEYFLTTPRPNIVFLILESFSAWSIPNFGGDAYAMYLDSLSRHGISFTRLYSSAYVSDQGMPAILSSYPSSPRMAITNQTTKSLNLDCISKDLKPIGYHSAFYFGGQLNYGNIKSYLYNMQFDEVKERNDFPSGLAEGKLGIHDRPMALQVVKQMHELKEPFLSCWFTISSHSPYDIPEPIKPIVNHRENPYINTVVYTDNALRDFFTEARTQPWFHNTLFVIVADHSHDNQKEFDYENKEFHRLPLIFYGDVIRPEFKGKKIDAVFSQLDIVPTLLAQMKLKSAQYVFGKNMFNPSVKHFAFFYFFHGTGFINDSCYVSTHKDTKELLRNDCSDSIQAATLRHFNQAFLQKEYEDYLGR